MNQLDALIVVRERLDTRQMALTHNGRMALAILDRKIAQLRRKNARRKSAPCSIEPPPTIIPCWSEAEAKRDQSRN